MGSQQGLGRPRPVRRFGRGSSMAGFRLPPLLTRFDASHGDFRAVSFRRAASIASVGALCLSGCTSDRSPVQVPIDSPGPGSSYGTGEVILLEDLTDRQVFPPSNWWNLDVSEAPLDPDSDAYIDWISGRTPQNPDARRRLHPDFGPPPYGIPYVTVSGTQPLVPVAFVWYPEESDVGAPGGPPGYPIPDEARELPNYIEGGVPGGGPSGDRHLLVIDRDRWLLFETWATR